MVVNVFKRSLSFPSKPPNRPSKPPISHHNRSISLPCRSHPLISHIQSEINELKDWSASPGERKSAWLCDGLTRLKDLHDSLSDLLQLPQTQELLRRRRLQWVEKLLEDFLSFVDVYGIFQTELMSFKEQQMAAQLAVRRKDKTKLALYLKARKKMGREMEKLTSTIRNIGSTTMQHGNISQVAVVSIGDVELAEVIEETSEVTKMVSLALVNGIATSFGSQRRYSFWIVKKKSAVKKVDESIVEFGESVIKKIVGENEEKMMALKKMRELNECIEVIENESLRVFRGLINTRVSLLNSLTL